MNKQLVTTAMTKSKKPTVFSLPVYLDSDIVDRTPVDLTEEQIQELLDALCAGYDNGEMERLHAKLLELNIIDPD